VVGLAAAAQVTKARPDGQGPGGGFGGRRRHGKVGDAQAAEAGLGSCGLGGRGAVPKSHRGEGAHRDGAGVEQVRMLNGQCL
jgi:hypothetical protein